MELNGRGFRHASRLAIARGKIAVDSHWHDQGRVDSISWTQQFRLACFLLAPR